MPGTLPDGEPVPAAGTLPQGARAGLGQRPFGLYVHVPFCSTRCGYCDFNTYTAAELGSGPAAVSPGSYPDLAIAELRFARQVLAGADITVSTVFFGGGTPTLLPPSALGRILRAIDAEFGLAPGGGGDHRGQSGERRRGQPPRAAVPGCDTYLVRHAERGARRAGRTGPGAPARPPGAVRRLGPRRPASST